MAVGQAATNAETQNGSRKQDLSATNYMVKPQTQGP